MILLALPVLLVVWVVAFLGAVLTALALALSYGLAIILRDGRSRCLLELRRQTGGRSAEPSTPPRSP